MPEIPSVFVSGQILERLHCCAARKIHDPHRRRHTSWPEDHRGRQRRTPAYPQRVRESFFSILGNAIPGRPFIDVFAGTGVIGIEAISRGATLATFLEKDPKSAADILRYLRDFDVVDEGLVLRTDVYRWAERWIPPLGKPLNLSLSPPFKDFDDNVPAFVRSVRLLWDELPDESAMTIQS